MPLPGVTVTGTLAGPLYQLIVAALGSQIKEHMGKTLTELITKAISGANPTPFAQPPAA